MVEVLSGVFLFGAFSEVFFKFSDALSFFSSNGRSFFALGSPDTMNDYAETSLSKDENIKMNLDRGNGFKIITDNTTTTTSTKSKS